MWGQRLTRCRLWIVFQISSDSVGPWTSPSTSHPGSSSPPSRTNRSSCPDHQPCLQNNRQHALPKQIKEKQLSWRPIPLTPCTSLSSSDQQGRAVESLCSRRILPELLYSLWHQRFTWTTRDVMFYQFCGVVVRESALKSSWSRQFQTIFLLSKNCHVFCSQWSRADGRQSYSDHQFMCPIILRTLVVEWKWWPQQESRENQATKLVRALRETGHFSK